ncbi:MAG: hypothetical protein K9I59_00170 [Chlorobium sp.]|uniref:hypothetical protein n=1 Tax=Chlorobium sp. TaxID=1095 RepID=UPI0025B914F8|nr:hypothetical protein [Chlorobium sp.]MCF8215274.1 hypothetical protein [Chlorobium sp.]MCF8270110.1 hypothetical protein [Chlorobium sp.]MCF8286480.1 hypothetical protein [Chlorobium sp.]MCF8290079.1 hypothetical protein [Chlorobium sp.]MCF8384150.1 hypothetical protein [Chlorobium sp.]
MKRKTTVFFGSALTALLLIAVTFTINQLAAFSELLGRLHPYAGYGFLAVASSIIIFALLSGIRFFSTPSHPPLPLNETAKNFSSYVDYLCGTLSAHPMHSEPLRKEKDLRWLRANLKLLEVDSLNATKQIATKNFFVGAFAQNTSYGTTTSLKNILKAVWRTYAIHHRNHHAMEFVALVRSVYACLPLSDFKKNDIPAHIKPIIQSSFSNTLSSLLPGGNLLTPFFMNLFLAGATNTYLTCLAGIIAIRHCQAVSEEDRREIVQQSMFEASFMLKEIVRECNPILSVTISNAVKKAGIESLDTVQSPAVGSNIAQDIVSHLASSLKNIIRENISVEKGSEQ